MMKIAHVTATFPPYWAGTGNVAYHNARLLHERGHDVTVFTAATPRDDEMDFEFRVERLAARVRFGNAPLTPQLLGKLRGFDVIHLHYPYIFGSELTALASRYVTDAPLTMTYHNDLLANGMRGAIFRVYTALNQRLILRAADRLAVTSRDYANHSSFARTAPGLEPFVLPNGVDTARFTPATPKPTRQLRQLGVTEGTPVALFVGGLDRAHYFKGIEVLLQALPECPDVHAVIVGAGELRPHYEAEAQRLAANRVHFAGKVALETLIELYQAATVTVLPSITQGEAFGMVLIESLACGTPVVASNLPGVRTVVENERDGYLVTPGDAGGVARALRQITDHPEKAREMGLAGRDKVVERYDWEVVGDRLETLYTELVERKMKKR